MNKSERSLASALAETVHFAEDLRVKSPEHALKIVDFSIETMEEQRLASETKKEISAGVCHLYLLGATINQSRAKHTLEKMEDKINALDKAGVYLDKAKPIGERLTQQGYLQTVDKTPFIWSAEIKRGMGRIKMRHPLSGEPQIIEAEGHFRQAKEIGLDVYKNEDYNKELRGAGLLTASLSRVEELTAKKRIVEQRNQVWPVREFQNDIVLSIAEIAEAKHLGYLNCNRSEAIFELIEKDLYKPDQLPYLHLRH